MDGFLVMFQFSTSKPIIKEMCKVSVDDSMHCVRFSHLGLSVDLLVVDCRFVDVVVG